MSNSHAWRALRIRRGWSVDASAADLLSRGIEEADTFVRRDGEGPEVGPRSAKAKQFTRPTHFDLVTQSKKTQDPCTCERR